jgi:hypothetical protein
MFDGANGVGAAKMNICSQHLGDSVRVQLYNGGTGTLNYLVSNEHVVIKTVLYPRKSGRIETV